MKPMGGEKSEDGAFGGDPLNKLQSWLVICEASRIVFYISQDLW